MLLTYRPGVIASSSRRVHVTAEAGSTATFFEMNTRPLFVAAHAVFVSPVERSTAVTAPWAAGGGGGARSPQAASVKGTVPRCAQSPQVAKFPGGLPVPVHSLQIACASAYVRVPRPAVFVRHAVSPFPANIVFETTGSLITGE